MSDDSALSGAAHNVLESARWAHLIYRSALDGTDQQSVRVPGAANDELLSRIAGDVQRELRQIVPYVAGRSAAT